MKHTEEPQGQGWRYYECHVTMPHLPSADGIMLARHTGWTYSAIGDPVVGPGTRSYLTKQFNANLSEVAVLRALDAVVAHVRLLGFPVERKKIELVVYDKRF